MLIILLILQYHVGTGREYINGKKVLPSLISAHLFKYFTNLLEKLTMAVGRLDPF